MDMVAKLEALAAGPKPFVLVLTFSDGTVERVAQPRQSQVDSMAKRYRAKIGRQFRLFNADFTQARFPTLVAVATESAKQESR